MDNLSTPKLGYTDDGAYLTPYRITIFYHTASIFETAIAALSSRSQLIPIIDDSAVDYRTAADVCEHPTPEVLIFGDAFSRENISHFFDRYTDLVHIFVYNDIQKQKYYDIIEGESLIFDPRVVCFDINDLYSHIILVNSLPAIYLLEHIMCATFSSYKSTNTDISSVTGKYLINALEYRASASQSIGMIILSLCLGIDGFDNIASAIAQGKTLFEYNESLISKQLSEGMLVKLSCGDSKDIRCWAVNMRSTSIKDIINLVPVHPKVVRSLPDIVLLYTCCPTETTMEWQVIIISITSKYSPVDILRPYADTIYQNAGIASARVPVSRAAGLLSFLYT